MVNEGYLFAAFTVVWIGVFSYVLFLASRQSELRREIEALKQGMKEKKNG